MRIAALLGLLAAALACSRAPARPNVILVSIDTLRWDHLGVYGYARATSPHIDALARDSIVFEQAVSHAPSTLASHASILTSLVPQHHGGSIGRETAVPPEVTTLAELLRDHGYATASFNGGVQLDPVYGLAQGFDVYDSVRAKDTIGHQLRAPEDRLSSRVARGLDWIERTRERPFFLFLHSYEVHHPYTPAEEFYVATDPDYAGVVPRDVSVDLLLAGIEGKLRFEASDRQRIVDAYDAEIRSVDAAVGRLVDELRHSGLLDDTLLILLSDHGEELGEHGWVGWHGHTLFDELLRIPLLVRLPGGEGGGRRVQHQVRGIDLAPTVLALLDIEIPAQFEGRPLLDADADDGERPSVSVTDTRAGENLVSLRTEEWKLTRRKLFHLAADAEERTDVATAHRAQADQLAGTLRSLAFARALQPGRPVELDAALRAGLQELGYVRAAASATPPLQEPGLCGSYYPNGGWQGEPVRRERTPRIEFDWSELSGPLPTPFSIAWTGTLRIDREGIYTFQLESDDGSILEISEVVVVDNGGPHPPRTRAGSVPLASGSHPVRIRYVNEVLRGVVRLAWQPPGGPLGSVPEELLTSSCSPPSR